MIRKEKEAAEEKKKTDRSSKSYNLYKYLTCMNHWLDQTSYDVQTSDSVTELEKAMRKSLGPDFDDVLEALSFSRHCPSKMRWCRFLAFVFGVLPEVISLVIITIAGVQYIVWSGFKVDSDTQGMEEIILATLAINFVYEIDDALYDHVFPGLYKEAHERDRFDITGFWTSSETIFILKKCRGAMSSWWQRCTPAMSEAKMKETKRECFQWLSHLECEPLQFEINSSSQLDRGFLIEVVSKGKVGPVTDKAESKGDQSGNERGTNDQPNLPRADLVYSQHTEQDKVSQLKHEASTEHGGGTHEDKSHLNAVERTELKGLRKKRETVLNEAEENRLRLLEEKEDKEIFDKVEDKRNKQQEGSKAKKHSTWQKHFNIDLKGLWGDLKGTTPLVQAMNMSTTEHWNDVYLAHAYHFLYARKLRYVFSSHWWEVFLVYYGKLGLHFIVLAIVTIAIVCWYRSHAQCDRFASEGSSLGIFSVQV